MSNFLYYLPHLPSSSLEAVRARVGHAIDRPGFATRRCLAGPDQAEGLLVGYFSGEERRLCYVPAEQAWRKIPGQNEHEKAWVGHYTASPPGPAELVRPDPLPGVPIVLGDGREWIIPVLLAWRGDEDAAGWQWQLPTRTDLDDEGRWVPGDVVPRYQALHRQAQRWFDYVTQCVSAAADAAPEADPDETVRVEIDTQDYFSTALAVLAANYRLVPADAITSADIALYRKNNPAPK